MVPPRSDRQRRRSRRPRRPILAAVLALVVAAAAVAAILWLGSLGEDPAVAQGGALYAEHCAACHGADLEGQPNWQEPLPDGTMPAPPHDASGHTWHHSDRDLFLITKHGMSAVVPGYDSGMPAYEGVLTDEEIRAVLAYIKSTWPERERRYQEERTRAEAESRADAI
jgi:mono/diheme cytochrome c family protein